MVEALGVDLGVLLRGDVAAAVFRSVTRDLTLQVRNGRVLPSWPEPVLRALAEAAGLVPDPRLMSAIGSATARMDVSPMVTVKVAALQVRRTERHVRRLCSEGRVIARRLGERSWLVDVASLQNVIGRASE